MKKKVLILIIVIIIAVLLSLGTFFMLNNNKKNVVKAEFYTEIYSRNTNVDDGVTEIMNSEEYKDMSENEKIEIVGEFLNLYVSDGTIKNLYYTESNSLYSFQYSDGSLGGVMLKDFNPMYN